MDMNIDIVFPSAIGAFVGCMCCLYLICYLGGRRNAAIQALATQQFLADAQERERQQLHNARAVEVEAVVVMLSV
jgi:hypothetical protein